MFVACLWELKSLYCAVESKSSSEERFKVDVV